MSPISPLTSVEGPRSHHGPGSVGYGTGGSSHDLASPASVSSSRPIGNSSSGAGANSSSSSSDTSKTPEANSLLLNLVLSDTLLNIFRDHNFDSCTLCVCSNEGNVQGRDAAVYLTPEFAGDDDIDCTCGYSAVINRRLSHQSGLFYEDETEVTSITEDLYFRKKPSLLLLDPKMATEDQNQLTEKAAEVDAIPQKLLELIHEQSKFFQSEQNTLVKYAKQYLKMVVQPPALSMVELMDGNDVIFLALDQIRSNAPSSAESSSSTAAAKMDDSLKGACFHKWSLLPSPGPLCSEDIIRVMKCLQPILNKSLHAKDSSSSSPLKVQGPLTWRQFHRMAGPATKGNTDDQCEPLPVPAVSVSHEKDSLSISPLALHFWESLNLEPFSQPRDVVHIVVAPDNDFLLSNVKTFFKNLSNVYEVSVCKQAH
jgi:mediator of RNA polymerase II transcription subunit 13